MAMKHVLYAETLVVALLVRRFNLPQSVALVLAGVVLTLQPLRPSLTPEVILALFVPPLVGERRRPRQAAPRLP